MIRGLNKRFLEAMRDKLEHGRWRGYVGWDQHWKNCTFYESTKGPTGFLMRRLTEEIIELVVALEGGDSDHILSEAADVANFAMMIADFHQTETKATK